MKKALILLVAGATLVSCSPTKFVKFTNADEIYHSDKLKSFLNENNSPKIVLRTNVGNVGENGTGSANTYLYDEIENEFLRQGFVVRDRQLFNQVASNEENNKDYAKLKEKTDTDLIVQLSRLDTNVLYETNKYYTAKGKEGLLPYYYRKYGATVEFRVVSVANNELAGIYRFNITPCTSETPCQLLSAKAYKKYLEEKNKPKAHEGVETNEMEVFIKSATKQLVKTMKK